MATVTHIIRSHYDPKLRERLELETGQFGEEDPWVTESAHFGRGRLLNAPRFVAASGSVTTTNEVNIAGASNHDISSWYAALNRSQSHTSENHINVQVSPTPALSTRTIEKEDPNRQDWFIAKALSLQGPCQAAPTPTLEDYLARDPPALPHERSFKPPVWLALGPSNKGYSMLERGGWTEGETLGRLPARSVKDAIRGQTAGSPKVEFRKLERWVDDEICEVRRAEVVDLTGLDDEEDEDLAAGSISMPASPQLTPFDSVQDDTTFTALLTPIATTLKSDRLGIGLKAKTVGPHRASKKRITHNAAALARHIRVAEEAKRNRIKDGRGRRGHERRNNREETHRKELLAYMNA